jgi:hypothetical protein
MGEGAMLIESRVRDINLMDTYGDPYPPVLRFIYRWSTGIASRYIMAQDIVVDIKDYLIDESPLVVCKGCGKLVPKTNLCLYCGAPILYRRESQS